MLYIKEILNYIYISISYNHIRKPNQNLAKKNNEGDTTMNKLNDETISTIEDSITTLEDRDDMFFSEMIALINMIKEGNAFDAISSAYSLGYARGKKIQSQNKNKPSE